MSNLPTSREARCETPREPALRGLSATEFGDIRPEDVVWSTFPAFPPSMRLSVLVGDPTSAGPFVIRVRMPAGERLMPHRHPEDRIYTVISGVFYIGLGEQFDPDRLKAYPPGSVIVLPGNTAHFHWAKSGDYVAQVTATGPLGLHYVAPSDDPRGQENCLSLTSEGE
jgi:quercetin dioxygenase-like cupin family protein